MLAKALGIVLINFTILGIKLSLFVNKAINLYALKLMAPLELLLVGLSSIPSWQSPQNCSLSSHQSICTSNLDVTLSRHKQMS